MVTAKLLAVPAFRHGPTMTIPMNAFSLHTEAVVKTIIFSRQKKSARVPVWSASKNTCWDSFNIFYTVLVEYLVRRLVYKHGLWKNEDIMYKWIDIYKI